MRNAFLIGALLTLTGLAALSAQSQQPQPPMPQTLPASQPSQSPDGVGTTSIVEGNHGSSILLLEHAQKLLDAAVDGKSEKMTIDRSILDEVRADITQVQLDLKSELTSKTAKTDKP